MQQSFLCDTALPIRFRGSSLSCKHWFFPVNHPAPSSASAQPSPRFWGPPCPHLIDVSTVGTIALEASGAGPTAVAGVFIHLHAVHTPEARVGTAVGALLMESWGEIEWGDSQSPTRNPSALCHLPTLHSPHTWHSMMVFRISDISFTWGWMGSQGNVSTCSPHLHQDGCPPHCSRKPGPGCHRAAPPGSG